MKIRLEFFRLGLFCLVVLLQCISCSESDEELRKELWIKNEVDFKIQSFISEKKAECLNSILSAAEAEVDSIISQKDLFGNVMDKDLPQKPEKPEFVPLDSTILESHEVKKVINK